MSSESSQPLRIIIVGAGIAGLSCARALRGHDVTVLEQSKMKSEVGAAIHLGPNASKIALDWGMDLNRLGSVECRWHIELDGPTGKLTHENSIDPRAIFGAPWLLNHRVDLHNELRRLAVTESVSGRPAVIRTSARVVSVDCNSGTVILATGEKLYADVIIGADGIHSCVRTSVLGNELIARPSGHSAYRCLIDSEKIAADKDLAFLVDPKGKPAVTVITGSDRRLVLYPCRNFKLLNVVAIVPDKYLGEDSVESWSAEGHVEEMVSAFSTFASHLQRLLRYAPSCGLWQLRDQDPLKSWVLGRTILVGDAAHAMLPHQGQGGSQSVEDGEALGSILAGLTREDADTIPHQLKLVEAARITRASTIQGYSRMKALGTRKSGSDVWVLGAAEFAQYNFTYDGCADWVKKQGCTLPISNASNFSKLSPFGALGLWPTLSLAACIFAFVVYFRV